MTPSSSSVMEGVAVSFMKSFLLLHSFLLLPIIGLILLHPVRDSSIGFNIIIGQNPKRAPVLAETVADQGDLLDNCSKRLSFRGQPMPRPLATCWEYGERLEGSRVRCTFCNRVIPSITLFKYHLASINHLRIRPCNQVPPSVAAAVQLLCSNIHPARAEKTPDVGVPHQRPPVHAETMPVEPRRHGATGKRPILNRIALV